MALDLRKIVSQLLAIKHLSDLEDSPSFGKKGFKRTRKRKITSDEKEAIVRDAISEGGVTRTRLEDLRLNSRARRAGDNFEHHPGLAARLTVDEIYQALNALVFAVGKIYNAGRILDVAKLGDITMEYNAYGLILGRGAMFFKGTSISNQSKRPYFYTAVPTPTVNCIVTVTAYHFRGYRQFDPKQGVQIGHALNALRTL